MSKSIQNLLEAIGNEYPNYGNINNLVLNKLDTVSFVIPTYNSASSLKHVIKSIQNQNLSSNINEIIIIDDYSSDNTESEVKILSSTSTIKIIYIKNKERLYSGYSRNIGTEVATGEVICFIDSDIIIPVDYLDYHLKIHSLHKDIITFSLRTDIELDELESVKLNPDNSLISTDFRKEIIDNTDELRQLGYLNSFDGITLPEVALTCAITYKRRDLIEVNGCPTNFVGWGFNDTVVAAKVISLGRYLVPLLDANVLHLSHPPRSGTSSKKKREYQNNKNRYEKLLTLSLSKASQKYISELD